MLIIGIIYSLEYYIWKRRLFLVIPAPLNSNFASQMAFLLITNLVLKGHVFFSGLQVMMYSGQRTDVQAPVLLWNFNHEA